MEWVAPGVILSVRPFGEGDAVVATLSEAQGRHMGLAYGGRSRRHAALWQPGNLVQLRWTGRLADQLGALSAELVHPAAALALDDPLALAILTAACAVADGALPERQAHPIVFGLLVGVISALADPEAALADLVRWEAALLAELGYGLDVARCAVTGASEDLAFVSPRTGRAVCRVAAGIWTERLLKLPRFMAAPGTAPLADLADGLRLTGHFLARDAFGSQNRPLPPARLALYDRVLRLIGAAAPPPD